MSPAPGPYVYLASQSPRRRQLLDQIGVAYELLLPEDAEAAEALEAVLPGEGATAYVERVTLAKLAAAQARWRDAQLPPAPILCADTTVALGRRILGKPRDAAQAAEMLQALSGREHRVITAVAVATARRTEQAVSVSKVRFALLSPTQVARYVASGEPLGKAGAYGIQGPAAAWVERISGSYSGIMGLPLFETARLLQRVGIASA